MGIISNFNFYLVLASVVYWLYDDRLNPGRFPDVCGEPGQQDDPAQEESEQEYEDLVSDPDHQSGGNLRGINGWARGHDVCVVCG